MVLERSALVLGADAPAIATLRPLGPGSGPWAIDPAEAHGLNSSLLQQAYDELRSQPHLRRHCFIVVKDGAIVHESYDSTFTGGVNNSHWGNSMTKTLASLLMGWATEHGTLDIDAPIDTLANSGPPLNLKPYPVTARQAMSQAIAGADGPGQLWAYDRYGYSWINSLIPLLMNASGGRLPSDIWKREFHDPLGLSSNFSWDSANSDFAFGSQGTCRDYARIGQLMLNEGQWSVGGRPKSIVPRTYVKQMSEPQTRYAPYPYYSSTCYGLLTWLNTNHNHSKYPGLCRSPGISVLGHLIPEGPPMPKTSMWPEGIPHNSYYAGGALGQITMVLPDYDAVVVSMGYSEADYQNMDHTAACVARSICRVFGAC